MPAGLHGILTLDDEEPDKIIFRERCAVFFDNLDTNWDNQFRKPTLDYLLIAQTFGLLDTIRSMVIKERCISKPLWKRIVWTRAWDLEKTFWTVQIRSHKSLELLNKVCHTPRYLIWWEISDLFPERMGSCEVMAKILCRCSMLKADDVRLRDAVVSC